MITLYREACYITMIKLKLYGCADSTEMYTIRDFLKRSVVEYELMDIGVPDDKLPEVEFSNGVRLQNPSLKEIADQLGWIIKPKYDEYDLAICGAGPSGLSAAVYGASEGLKTILIERSAVGGQAGTSSMIENYLGFPKGISGAELADRAREQALKFGVEILMLREGIRGYFADSRISIDLKDGSYLRSKASICSTGVEYTRLDLENEAQFLHRGLYYGAGASEANLCGGLDIYIVGGGNMAGQAAVYFAGFARNVYMVVRKDSLAATASDYLVKRIYSSRNIEVLHNTEVIAIDGDRDLARIKTVDNRTGQETWRPTGKLFVCIGGEPNTDWAEREKILRCKKGYLFTGPDLVGHQSYKDYWAHERLPYHMETSMPGLFAVGDVRWGSVKRVASAVGEGAMAVTQIHQFLANDLNNN